MNITDGLDGLAITPSLFVVAVLGIFAYVEGNRIYSAICSIPTPGGGRIDHFWRGLCGSRSGVLWYNAYPAQIFMGDTGSWPSAEPWRPCRCCSNRKCSSRSWVDYSWLKRYQPDPRQDRVKWLGRRIFYRAPLHHNLQHKGIAETKVVIRLWIVAGILALISLATLKLR